MRILVCGDRDWDDIEAIVRELSKFPAESSTVVIHGAQRGADTIAGVVAEELGMTVIAFPADWNLYGRFAGPIRNKQMLVEGQPDVVFAFHHDLTKSRGTKNMVKQASDANVPVKVFE